MTTARPGCRDRADRSARLRSDRQRLAGVIAAIKSGQTHEALPLDLALAIRLACRVETKHSRRMRSANPVALIYKNTYESMLLGNVAITEENLSPMVELIIGGLLLQRRLTVTNRGRYVDSHQFRAMLMTVHLTSWEIAEWVIGEIETIFKKFGQEFLYVGSYESGRDRETPHFHLIGLFPHSNATRGCRRLYGEIRDYFKKRNGNRPGCAGHVMRCGAKTNAQLKPIDANLKPLPAYDVGGFLRNLCYISKDQPGYLTDSNDWDRRHPIMMSERLREEVRSLIEACSRHLQEAQGVLDQRESASTNASTVDDARTGRISKAGGPSDNTDRRHPLCPEGLHENGGLLAGSLETNGGEKEGHDPPDLCGHQRGARPGSLLTAFKARFPHHNAISRTLRLYDGGKVWRSIFWPPSRPFTSSRRNHSCVPDPRARPPPLGGWSETSVLSCGGR
jgi:hypothetical protein